MEIISYRYTNSMKQILILFIMLYFLLRLVVMGEIVFFNIPGYEVNILLTILLYALIFAVLISFLLGYKFCYTLYDDETITYYNRLSRKDKSIEMKDVKKIVFGKKGVEFFDGEEGNLLLYIPFFRGGIVDALEINKFYTKMKERGNIHLIKDFTTLPGYGKGWWLLKMLYAFIAILIFLNCFTPLATVIILYQNFMM